MKEKYIVNKKWGETPLEALSRLRAEENIPADVPMTYAGRLDPAAEGLLIILTGEECKKKDEYTKLSKTYEAEIIFGVKTDSYDLLGVPMLAPDTDKDIHTFLGRHMQAYPPYSSKNIDSGVILPPHEVEIFEIRNLGEGERTREEILERVDELTKIVAGDFRQAKIAKAWHALPLPGKLRTIKVELKVSSGFYVRQLAEDLGGTLYSLVRTEIGEVQSAS